MALSSFRLLSLRCVPFAPGFSKLLMLSMSTGFLVKDRAFEDSKISRGRNSFRSTGVASRQVTPCSVRTSTRAQSRSRRRQALSHLRPQPRPRVSPEVRAAGSLGPQGLGRVHPLPAQSTIVDFMVMEISGSGGVPTASTLWGSRGNSRRCERGERKWGRDCQSPPPLLGEQRGL